MKRLRHRLGHWLLRDEPKPRVEVYLNASDTSAKEIHRMLLRLKRDRGNGELWLS